MVVMVHLELLTQAVVVVAHRFHKQLVVLAEVLEVQVL
jgi:hypothetical protein